ncbi:hypothetical protein [Luteimonas sp. R10]|uniref:hypothetical protein n=1 Tax=Luteimonas sp. R10 TaxID=3108176 RepID=UPI003089499A|nr:hypothetical protein U3649_10475 [Luteimonas sp. R10]
MRPRRISSLVAACPSGFRRPLPARDRGWNTESGVGDHPECNPLLSVEHHAIDSHVPAVKSIPVRVRGGSRAPAPAGPEPV